MNKILFLSLTFLFLSSCIGKMSPTPDIQVRGDYKFEFLAKSDGEVWNLDTTNSENTGTIFINLKDIYSDVELFIKITKNAKNFLSRESRLNINKNFVDKVDGEDLYFIDASNCENALMDTDSSCVIKVVAKYNENGTDIGLLDGLDLSIQEKVSTTYEEALKINLSVDMHRKVKGSLSNVYSSDIDFGELNYFKHSSKSVDLFNVEGEFNYITETILSSNQSDYDLSIEDTNKIIKSNINYKYYEGVSDGIKNTNLNVKVIFENGDEEFVTIPIKAKRKSRPDLKLNVTGNDFAWTLNNESKTVTIKNQGDTYLDITGILIGDNTNFNITNVSNCIRELNKNEHCQFQLIYTPSDLGESYQTTLNINAVSDEHNINKEQVMAGGVADPPVLISLEGESHDFGSKLINTSEIKNFTIKNTKALAAQIDLSQITIINNTNGAYSFNADQSCEILDENETCNISVTFKPSVSGTFNNRKLRIKYTDAYNLLGSPESPLEITLNGQAKTPAILSFSVSDFGELLRGSTNSTNCANNYCGKKSQNITITNTGQWPVTLQTKDISIIGAHASSFLSVQDVNCNNNVLTQNQSCSVILNIDVENLSPVITRGPLANYKLNITYNNGSASVESNDTINATVLDKGTLVVVGGFDFNTPIIVGESATSTITLTNTNDPNEDYIADIKINDYVLSNPDGESFFSVQDPNSCFSNNLELNEQCSFTLKYQPTGAFIFGADSASFPYTDLSLDDVTKDLINALVISYSDFTTILMVLNEITAKVAKPAQLVITAVSTASRRNSNPDSYLYHYFEKSLPTLSAEGKAYDKVGDIGLYDANGVGNHTWDFGKDYIDSTSVSLSFLELKIKNIGYKSATDVNLDITNTSGSTFTYSYLGAISRLSSPTVNIVFRANGVGIKEATLNGILYKSESDTTQKDVSMGNGNILLKGYGVEKPQIYFYKCNNGIGCDINSDELWTETDNFEYENIVYNDEFPTEINTKYKIVISQSSNIDDEYKVYLNNNNNYNYIPYINFEQYSLFDFIPIVSLTGDESYIDSSNKRIKDFSADISTSSFSFDYNVLISSSALNLTNKFTYEDLFCAFKSQTKSLEIKYNTYNRYENPDSLPETETIKSITYKNTNIPALSLSEYTQDDSGNYSYCFSNFNNADVVSNSAKKEITLTNNTQNIIKVKNVETYTSCAEDSTQYYKILFNGDTGCTITDNPCSNFTVDGPFDIQAGSSCKVCLKFTKDPGYISGKILQDINIEYDIYKDSNPVVSDTATNFYFSTSLIQPGFDMSTDQQRISKDNETYEPYLDSSNFDHLCDPNLLNNAIYTQNNFYFKYSIKPNDFVTIDPGSFSSTIYFYNHLDVIRSILINNSNREVTNGDFRAKIESVVCDGRDVLNETQNFLIDSNDYCHFVFKFSLNSNDYSYFCNLYGVENFRIKHQHTYVGYVVEKLSLQQKQSGCFIGEDHSGNLNAFYMLN